jgi:hypothetical protein
MNNSRSTRATTRILQLTLLVLIVSWIASAQVASTGSPWAKVPPVDWTKVKPQDFSDDELDLPYYLANFNRLANSVVETGENRGFIDLAVWRNREDNRPYNARIMENILSLAFFYSNHRPWNQYYGSPAVRLRLEAALDLWCRMESDDGRFSEYGPRQWNLAATAFATKFMGQTLTLLHGGPPIDQKLLARVAASDRRAIHFVLTDPEMYRHGKDFTNQFTNAWAGALAYLKLFPDTELASLISQSIKENTHVFQSSAGYFYEARGADWGYNLGTHHSNLAMSWHYLRGTDLGKLLVDEEKQYVEWLAYNAVLEPDGSGFTLNRAIETRQKKPFLDSEGITRSQEEQGQRLLGSEVELARAFLPTREEVERDRALRRAELRKNWPPARELAVGTFSTYSPYAFLHRSHEKWVSTSEQRDAAVKALPYMKSQFIHQRVDNREHVAFTFVKRPTYYAILNSGPHLTNQQRYGLGLIWQPEIGSLLQSQTGSNEAAWGTVLGEKPGVFEADSLDAEFSIDGKAVSLQTGNHDLPSGLLKVKYRFSDLGDKTLTFEDQGITVEVDHRGLLTEQIPLLVGKEDRLSVKLGEITLMRAGKVFSIKFDPEAQAESTETGMVVGKHRVVVVRLKSRNSLTYRMEFSGMGMK